MKARSRMIAYSGIAGFAAGRRTLPGLSRYLNRPVTGVPGLRPAARRLHRITKAVSSTLKMYGKISMAKPRRLQDRARL